MTDRPGQRMYRREEPVERIPVWFKVWTAICAVVGLGVTGVVVWAITKIVNHVAG